MTGSQKVYWIWHIMDVSLSTSGITLGLMTTMWRKWFKEDRVNPGRPQIFTDLDAAGPQISTSADINCNVINIIKKTFISSHHRWNNLINTAFQSRSRFKFKRKGGFEWEERRQRKPIMMAACISTNTDQHLICLLSLDLDHKKGCS